MRALNLPAFEAVEVLDNCIASIRDEAIRGKITQDRQRIIDEIEKYSWSVSVAKGFELQTTRDLANALNKEAKILYKDGMIWEKGLARSIYISLRKSTRFNICPLCGQNQVSTLDHYLPQSRYACFVVLPINLIPACHDCNKFKLARVPKSCGEQTLHPYFDDFSHDQWLVATLDQTEPPAIIFSASPPERWPEDDKSRVRTHMKTFKLGDLYASNAANELVNIKLALSELHAAGGALEVHSELDRRARSAEAVQKNAWQTALYQALSSSPWFCDGGFAAIS